MRNIHNNLQQEMLQAKADCRDKIELLRRRVNLLKGKDKLLLTMYLDNSNSYRQISRLAGINEANISRRIKRIINRLLDSNYIICLRNCDRFTARELAIAKEYFLLGLSIKKIAERKRWTYYQTHKTIRKIQQHLKNNTQETCPPYKTLGRRD